MILSDLSQCLPGDTVTRQSSHQGTWMLLDYSTAATVDLPPVQGTMVYGAGRLGSPPLTLPLPVQGCYTIYIACWHDIHMGGSRLRLRLSED